MKHALVLAHGHTLRTNLAAPRTRRPRLAAHLGHFEKEKRGLLEVCREERRAALAVWREKSKASLTTAEVGKKKNTEVGKKKNCLC